jgi:hypothetical protein
MYRIAGICLLLVSALGLSMKLHSQTVMGIHAGLNASILAGAKDYEENKTRIALNGYGFADFSLGRFSILSIETGLGITQLGMQHVQITNNLTSRTTRTIKNKLDYVIIPFYLKENFTNFYTKIGPYAAYNIKAVSSYREEVTQSFQLIKEPVEGNDATFEQNVNPYDAGISFGCGYIHFFEPSAKRRYGRGRSKLTPVVKIDFRFNMGLIPIGIDPNVPNMNLRNQSFTIGATLTSVRN